MPAVYTFPECKEGRHAPKCPGQKAAPKGNFGGAVCNCGCHKTNKPLPRKHLSSERLPAGVRRAAVLAVMAAENLKAAKELLAEAAAGSHSKKKRTAAEQSVLAARDALKKTQALFILRIRELSW